jgi:hypothetical protein
MGNLNINHFARSNPNSGANELDRKNGDKPVRKNARDYIDLARKIEGASLAEVTMLIESISNQPGKDKTGINETAFKSIKKDFDAINKGTENKVILLREFVDNSKKDVPKYMENTIGTLKEMLKELNPAAFNERYPKLDSNRADDHFKQKCQIHTVQNREAIVDIVGLKNMNQLIQEIEQKLDTYKNTNDSSIETFRDLFEPIKEDFKTIQKNPVTNEEKREVFLQLTELGKKKGVTMSILRRVL